MHRRRHVARQRAPQHLQPILPDSQRIASLKRVLLAIEKPAIRAAQPIGGGGELIDEGAGFGV
jgi:hypothetical protein